jgi:hypothetical protein
LRLQTPITRTTITFDRLPAKLGDLPAIYESFDEKSNDH